jgi:CheY-like chemotaxis protein
MRVLFVDDEPNTREIYRRLFELAGHDVVTAASAEAAVRAIDDRPFDVAFVDIVLGGADGLTVVRHLRDHQPAARAILVSAYEPPAGKTSGAEAFLAKPLRWRDLEVFLNQGSCEAPA